MKFGGQPTPWSETETEGLRLRSVSQILIQEIGAAGPENAEDSARRACGVIQRQADQIVSADALIAELEAKVARMRVDSERYRWLTSDPIRWEEDCGVSGYILRIDGAKLRGVTIHEAIDAARANGGEG